MAAETKEIKVIRLRVLSADGHHVELPTIAASYSPKLYTWDEKTEIPASAATVSLFAAYVAHWEAKESVMNTSIEATKDSKLETAIDTWDAKWIGALTLEQSVEMLKLCDVMGLDNLMNKVSYHVALLAIRATEGRLDPEELTKFFTTRCRPKKEAPKV